MRTFALAVAAAALLAGAGAANASSIVYQPANPTFGGYAANGALLLSEAQAQNGFTAKTPTIPGVTTNQSPAQQFAATIQSRLLSALADKITNAVFGENPQQQGTFTVGGTTISFDHVGSNVVLHVNDGSTTTTITLPGSF
ncbi:MAG TPA: curli assembly protein CsgF [Hyphomicrobiales bacterium]|nr:curli assembly protein CsgF [Hyphomicrobiales bacterium]